MAKRKTDHTGFRNEALFCFNCGTSQKLPLPMDIRLAGEWMKSFSKVHKDCQKTWVEPVVENNGKTEKENMDWWLAHGEQGLSSKTIFRYLGGINLNGQWGDHTPSDPDDFKRCYKLIKSIPQWRERLHEMKAVSPVWANIVDNWDKLSSMYEQNVKEHWKNYKRIGMYEFMKSIGC